MNRRLGAGRLDRHAADGVDSLFRRKPAQIAVATVIVGFLSTVVMAMPHDVRAPQPNLLMEKNTPAQSRKYKIFPSCWDIGFTPVYYLAHIIPIGPIMMLSAIFFCSALKEA